MTDRTFVVVSTCPCTKCPPRRPSAASERSRFTPAPGTRVCRFVRRSVSSRRSNSITPSKARVTVRQHPFTATLSPVATVSEIRGARTPNRAPSAPTLSHSQHPISSTSPVNMPPTIHPSAHPLQIKSPPAAKQHHTIYRGPKNLDDRSFFCHYFKVGGAGRSGLPMGGAVVDTACDVHAHFFCAPENFCRPGCLDLSCRVLVWRWGNGTGGGFSNAS